MRSNFSFRNLFKRLPDVSIPKEFIYYGIGLILIILIGLIAGNMYLQEMLFNEGIQKSTPIFSEEELREYGALYKELEIDFQSKVASYIQNYANRTNRLGNRIKWGVYGQNNTEDLVNSDFVDGVTIKYIETGGKSIGESNYQDILAAVSILVDQRQSKAEMDERYKQKIKNLIKEIYNMSHTINGTSTALYPCTHGCFCDFYHCSDAMDEPVWDHCNIKYEPFKVTPHSEYDDYSSDDFEIVNMLGECEVCKDDTSKRCYEVRGCVQDGTCYHGDDDSEVDDDYEGPPIIPHYLGKGKKENFESMCSNAEEFEDCEHECGDACEEECIHEHTDDCYYCICNGHEHYCCPDGHFYVCCMGHTNLTVNIKIMYLDEIVSVLKTGYSID